MRYTIGAGLTVGLLSAIAVMRDEIAMCPALVIPFAAALLTVGLGTFANRLPGLHHLPLVGAPQPPRVDLRVEGGDGMPVRLSHEGPDSIVLRVTLRSRPRDAHTRVLINAWVVGSLAIERCDHEGAPKKGKGSGSSMPGEDGPFWALGDESWTGEARVLFLKVQLPGPGTYEAATSISSPDYQSPHDHFTREPLIVLPPESSGR